MLIRVLIYLVLGTSAAAAASTWWALHLRGEVATQKALVAGYQEAAKMLDAHLRFADAERRKWQTVASDAAKIEGADETLNPYERAILDRVRNDAGRP